MGETTKPEKRKVLVLAEGLIPAFPYCDLDGTPHPGCDHQHTTEDPVERAILEGIASALVKIGLPKPFVRAGEEIETTWGCGRNKIRKARKAIVDSVTLVLRRDRMSMWYRPGYEYTAIEKRHFGEGGAHPSKGRHRYSRMFLVDIKRQDGVSWELQSGGSTAPFSFRVEWISPITSKIERAYQGKFTD